MNPRFSRSLAVGLVAGLLAVGCGSDGGGSGGTVEEIDDSGSGSGSGSGSASGSGSGSGSGSASASGSGSATGISEQEPAEGADDPQVEAAVVGYTAYVEEQIGIMQVETARFSEAVCAGDVKTAQELYQVSRRSWGRIALIAGMIEDIDDAVDAREDDFEGPDDPDFTGWHRLEYALWVEEDLTGMCPIAQQLEADLQVLADTFATIELEPGSLTVGVRQLIEGMAAPDGTLSGAEERYSETDLYVIAANLEGVEALIELLRPALEEAAPELLAQIDALLAELDAQLARFGSFEDGYAPYSEVTQEQREELAATLTELAEALSQLDRALGLE